jgi:hypothetical protein
MEPRGFLETWFEISFLSGLSYGFLMTLFTGWPPLLGLMVGVLFGILFGLFVAPSMMGAKLFVAYTDEKLFVSRLNITMALLNYNLDRQIENYLVFRTASFGNFSVAGLLITPASLLAITIQLHGNSATMFGPKHLITKVQKRLMKY